MRAGTRREVLQRVAGSGGMLAGGVLGAACGAGGGAGGAGGGATASI
jgi:hypothetical protein